MAFVDPRPGKVYLKNTSLAHGDVSGIIGITGSLAISFGESCICHLVGSMLGETYAEANQEVFDGVVNQKTTILLATTENQNPPSDGIPSSAWAGKKEMIKKKLHEIKAIRDDMVKQLGDKPFMEISQRQSLKKRIPMLEVQIKCLRLDLSTAEMLSNISKDELEHPKLVRHYQHYETEKRKS
jgi:hypothetical protein